MKRPPADVLLDRKIEALIADGLPLPRWGFPLPPAYNGATGEERIRGWQKVRIAQRLGYLPRPSWCGVCGAPNPPHYHSELYFRPMTSKPVCRSCHHRIHRRFADPARWRDFLEGISAESWAHLLLTEQIERAEAIRLAAEHDWWAALTASREAGRASQ